MTAMTVDLLKATLPKALQGNATQELADHINNIALDPEVAEEVRSNFLSYTKVLQDGKFKTESYLDAVVYVTHKLMQYSNQDAWIRTFPQRYQTLVAKGADSKTISAHVAAYHANKLVNLILEQSIIPSWLLNRDVYQRAINTQFELMTDPDVSAKVRSDAANSILTHLKQPETQKVELEVGVKNSGGIGDLMATMSQLARQQQELIQRGVPARQVARDRLVIEGEVTDVPSTVIPAPQPQKPEPALPPPVAPPKSTATLEASSLETDVGSAEKHSEEALPQRAMFQRDPGAPQPGNPGTPPVPSLFAQRSADAPGATAAQPPASAEGAARDAGPKPSLFDFMAAPGGDA